MNNINSNKHISVRLEDAVDSLNIQKDKIYVDCTFGRGGHSFEILKRLSSKGKLFVFDLDLDAKKYFDNNFSKFKNCFFIQDNFKNLKENLAKFDISKVDGFLFDFGVSSPMLDNANRGFSFKLDARLDMRMNQNQELSAYEVINNYSKEKLIQIFWKYGEIRNPVPVVDEIIKYRSNKPIETTLELVDIIRKRTPIKIQREKKHFARTYFQAIRIEVNDELNSIRKALSDALNMLSKNGRIVTISFHSLEEKEIKNTYKDVLESKIPKEVPINNSFDFKIIKIKPKRASSSELEENNRTRSSFLKVIERVNE
ncbi:16S rRNA (cytosine(1402)-N(4))-methyltransferase RsmH [Malacoplasma penetrans]|uniref:Ribosomal RNA small subunit methyltransferase H n=1 Tax=Malacoplasma penetrans (strain HF-2) TaxID=272633 RepID=RSMH_MALP2|nr:16S rRNA (cytosine(1402)-N(4))-methyltransferase RsmH [Malacoplasma penetrans]Q8EW81.1 RecName: Full=Ribosomal RNA small subunit methyltransferase H; AltName: Full=16S rRNA m(4)C1402 methyltransferase; AltName: Full=rRNA (cytosine-N(4)-)-methyltransferase RsmH [Malacoplasma penetrans HF-2]RXY96616.1 16S rRNA (cytosine(1402)-N(4))-methyltransferase RsmH [Malacoplasma penetrans]BAC44115.1 methyltransferase [Malacoplasma penetrans HF-2]